MWLSGVACGCPWGFVVACACLRMFVAIYGCLGLSAVVCGSWWSVARGGPWFVVVRGPCSVLRFGPVGRAALGICSYTCKCIYIDYCDLVDLCMYIYNENYPAKWGDPIVIPLRKRCNCHSTDHIWMKKFLIKKFRGSI